MPRLYGELDLLVSTSRSEAMPLALMEGMACGVPIVATRVGGVPEIIEQSVTGLLVGTRDYEAAAACVVELLASPTRRLRMGLAARARALRRFDLDESVSQVTQLLARLAAPRSTPRRMSAVSSDGPSAPAN